MQALNLGIRVLLFVTLIPAGAFADGQTPMVPQSTEWTAIACDNWNCATAALALANGDRFTLMTPTNSSQYGWVVLRRVQSGSFYVPADAPFVLEPYDGISDGVARFSGLKSDVAPMMLTVPDGKTLVLYLRQPEPHRHAAAH